MNKNDLIEKVAGETGLMKRDVRAAVNATLGVISCTLEGGEKVTLVGFGTFRAVDRKARSGRNPQTGGEGKSLRRIGKENASCYGTCRRQLLPACSQDNAMFKTPGVSALCRVSRWLFPAPQGSYRWRRCTHRSVLYYQVQS